MKKKSKNIIRRARQPTKKKKKGAAAKSAINVRFQDVDSNFGITKKTAVKVAKDMGLSLSAFFHVAAIQLIRRSYPQYPEPDTEVTAEGIAHMETLSGPVPEGGRIIFSALDL